MHWLVLFLIKNHRCVVRNHLNLVCHIEEEHRLKVLENEILRKIFGPKRYEVTGEWRKLHNEELNDLYSSPKIIRVIK